MRAQVAHVTQCQLNVQTRNLLMSEQNLITRLKFELTSKSKDFLARVGLVLSLATIAKLHINSHITRILATTATATNHRYAGQVSALTSQMTSSHQSIAYDI